MDGNELRFIEDLFNMNFFGGCTMKELYIHIGLSKTGSSAIQSWLSLNADRLKKQGYDYADLSPSAKNGKITAGNGVLLFQACNQQNWAEVERLIAHVYFMRNNKAIVSSESLQGVSVEAINKISSLCNRHSIRVKVIAYARSAYELLYSNYLQGIKRHGFTFAFGEEQKLSYLTQRQYLQNYYNVFDKNLQIVNYDSVKNDIFSSFSSCVGFIDKGLVVKNKKVNRSLTVAEASLLLQMNKIHNGIFSTEISDYLIEGSSSKLTSVLYSEKLIEKVKFNTTDDLIWINETFSPIGGNIETWHAEISNDNETTEDYESIIDTVIQWALGYENQRKKTEFVEFLRDFAVFLENDFIHKSLLLMEKAKKLRPNGAFILRRVDIYKEQIKTHNNKMYE